MHALDHMPVLQQDAQYTRKTSYAHQDEAPTTTSKCRNAPRNEKLTYRRKADQYSTQDQRELSGTPTASRKTLPSEQYCENATHRANPKIYAIWENKTEGNMHDKTQSSQGPPQIKKKKGNPTPRMDLLQVPMRRSMKKS